MSNHHEETKDERITPHEKAVMEEAEEYYTKAKELRESKWKMDDEDMYIMDRLWLKKWKEYTNYSFIKRKMQYSFYSQNKIKKYEINPELHPGQIDNQRILVPMKDFLNDGNMNDQSNLVVRKDLGQRENIKFVYKKLWDFFYSRYGGGPVILRKKISDGSLYSTRKIVELYYTEVNLIVLPPRKKLNKDAINTLNTHSLYVSRTKTLPELKQRYLDIIFSDEQRKKEFPIFTPSKSEVKVENIRLWKIESTSSITEFKDFLLENVDDIVNTDSQLDAEKHLYYLEHVPKIPLKELEFAETDTCIVEYVEDDDSPPLFEVNKVEMKDGICEWCRERKLLRFFCACKEVYYCTQNCKEKDINFHSARCKKAFTPQEDSIKVTAGSRRGLVGLQNLGNTCFMNTSLQCMSNCKELTDYFLNDYYKDHINLDNPIGTQGVLARSYSNLLKNLWFGTSSVYSPWNFKSAISTFQSMFTGYQQHDTQEFLNYLLDGLHEDLNKVLKKPIIDKDESKKEDRIKAKEQWIDFLRRNQSVLVDLLYGQYKSTLYCPNTSCQNVSTTFDPFLSLTLPLAAGNEKYEVTCYYIFYDVSISPIQLIIPFTSEVAIIALRNKIAKLIEVHPMSFFLIKLDCSGELEYFINSSQLIRPSRMSRSNTFFCFQIDPKLFYSNINNNIQDINEKNAHRDYSQTYEGLKKRREEVKHMFYEDYQEDESGITKYSTSYYSSVITKNLGEKVKEELHLNTDENHGLKDNMIRIILNLRKYDDTYSGLRKKLIFPRILYINKEWSTKRLHHTLLNYFSNLLKTYHNIKNDENLWDTFFSDIEEYLATNSSITMEQHRNKAYPYVIRMRSIFSENEEFCLYCNQKKCDNCLLPYSDNITIDDLLNKIPRNAKGMQVDNTYYYLNDNQRRLLGGDRAEMDFSLDVTWLSTYITHVRTLNDKTDFHININKASREDTISINTCFKNFVKLEKLKEGNEWYCNQCKSHQLAEKKMEIFKCPHILIIHLKRFRNGSKIDNVVDFPIKGLDMSNYIIHTEEKFPMVYDLFAIANHYGGLGGGHYIAYAKNPYDSSWYSYNDSSVSKISEDQLITGGAYVLFYRRRSMNELVKVEEIYKKPFVDYEKIIRTSNKMEVDN